MCTGTFQTEAGKFFALALFRPRLSLRKSHMQLLVGKAEIKVFARRAKVSHRSAPLTRLSALELYLDLGHETLGSQANRS